MPQFRKKPCVIEAHRLPAVGEAATDDLIDFLHAMDQDWSCEKDGTMSIYTLEGEMMASPGDWIIKGVAGEYYPCKHDIFEITYEQAQGGEHSGVAPRSKMIEAMQEFVDRCDKGEIRSKYTYAKFKELLSHE